MSTASTSHSDDGVSDERPGTDAEDVFRPRLLELVEGCTDSEVEDLVDLIETSRRESPTFDKLGLIHGNMKADLYSALTTDYEELLTIPAPAIYKLYGDAEKVHLPAEPIRFEHTLDQVIEARASRRDYGRAPVSLEEVGTLLHYTAGVKKHIMAYNLREFPVRFQPNAGGLQSYEMYLVVNNVSGLRRGLYHYDPQDHCLSLINEGNLRRRVTGCCLHQEWVSHANAVIIFTTVMERLYWKYGIRSYRYAHVDVGIATGALYLLATALKLRACAVSGFMDDLVNELVDVDGRSEFAQLLFAVGTRPWTPADRTTEAPTGGDTDSQ